MRDVDWNQQVCFSARGLSLVPKHSGRELALCPNKPMWVIPQLQRAPPGDLPPGLWELDSYRSRDAGSPWFSVDVWDLSEGYARHPWTWSKAHSNAGGTPGKTRETRTCRERAVQREPVPGLSMGIHDTLPSYNCIYQTWPPNTPREAI